jgi:hypothetical protein
MPCVKIKIGNSTGILCGRGRRPKPCFYCGKRSEFLCDFPVGKTKKGKLKTCDIPLCSRLTLKGISPDVDFCKTHYPLAKAAYERRAAKQKEM